MDTNKPKVDYLFFGLVVGFETELGYFSLNELKTAKEGLERTAGITNRAGYSFQSATTFRGEKTASHFMMTRSPR